MRILSLASIIFIGASCSTFSQKKRSVVDEVNEGKISTATVMDLARSSYLKGCVDGKNTFAPEKSSMSVFEPCLKMAREHQEEIRYIIEQSSKKK